MDTLDTLVKRINDVAAHSRRIKNPTTSRDMMKLADNSHDLLMDLSRELVECRRRNKLSPKSKDLLQALDESIEHAEKMLTYAQLLGS
jgi:hypothetical protein